MVWLKKEIKKSTAIKESSRMVHFLTKVRQQPVDSIYEQRTGEKQKPKNIRAIYYTRNRLIS